MLEEFSQTVIVPLLYHYNYLFNDFYSKGLSLIGLVLNLLNKILGLLDGLESYQSSRKGRAGSIIDDLGLADLLIESLAQIEKLLLTHLLGKSSNDNLNLISPANDQFLLLSLLLIVDIPIVLLLSKDLYIATLRSLPLRLSGQLVKIVDISTLILKLIEDLHLLSVLGLDIILLFVIFSLLQQLPGIDNLERVSLRESLIAIELSLGYYWLFFGVESQEAEFEVWVVLVRNKLDLLDGSKS